MLIPGANAARNGAWVSELQCVEVDQVKEENQFVLECIELLDT